MERRFKKLIAVVCSIAMVVSSITIYNLKSAKAETDYSTLTYMTVDGTSYAVAPQEDFPISWVRMEGDAIMFELGVATGTNPIWPAFSDMTLNGNPVDSSHTAGAWMKVWPSELNDNAYNVIEATSAVTSEKFHVIVKNGTPSSGAVETTTVDPDAPTTTPAPTTTTALAVPTIGGQPVISLNDFGQGYVVYVAGLNSNIQNATSYNLYVDDELYDSVTEGQNIPVSNFKAGSHTFCVTGVNAAGESAKTNAVTLQIPGTSTETTSTETTTAGEEFDPSTITDWTAVTGSTTLSYYIADNAGTRVSVKPEMHGDSTVYSAYMLAAKFTSVTLDEEAIALRDGADVEVEKSKFTEGYHKLVVVNAYNTETVTIYFKAIAEVPTTTAEIATTATYEVSVDGTKVADVAENDKYTLPATATYGYYADGEMYKAGAEVTVTKAMAFASVNTLSVEVDNRGAGIRTTAPAGLRFQATITSNNMTAVDSTAITEGMLITANDIFENNNSQLNLTTACAKINVVNSGWYDADKNGTADVGSYCGSIVNVVQSNYVRKFIARAYVTVTYSDGTSTTIYSDMGPIRSIAQVAQAVKNAGYPSMTSDEIDTVNSFLS